MAVTKTVVNLIGTFASPTTVTAGNSTTSASVDASTFVDLMIQTYVTFGASTTADALVQVITSSDNSHFDTEVLGGGNYPVPLSAGAAVQRSIPLNALPIKYFKVKVTNQSAAGANTDITVWVDIVEVTN